MWSHLIPTPFPTKNVSPDVTVGWAHTVPPRTGLFQLVTDLIVGTCKVADGLPVALTLGQPAVTLEAESLVTGVVLHINVVQVPAREYPCGRKDREWEVAPLPVKTSLLPSIAVWPWTSSLSSLRSGSLVDEVTSSFDLRNTGVFPQEMLAVGSRKLQYFPPTNFFH